MTALSLIPAVAVAEGPELSGNVTTFAGWQSDNENYINLDGFNTNFGGIPERALNAPDRSTFNFYVDEVELSIQKDWGDNIRLRADLDFGADGLGSNFSDGGDGFFLEQAYVTVGFGSAEFLVGRFNVPIGVYSVDRIDNVSISYPYTFSYLPANATGAKIFFTLGESLDFQVYAINNIADTLNAEQMPTFGARLGLNFGSEERPSTVGISGLVGPQIKDATFDTESPLTIIGDLDISWWLSDSFLIQAEFLYRIDQNGNDGVDDSTVMAAMLLLDWQASESFDIYLGAGYVNDSEGGVEGTAVAGGINRFDGSVINALVGIGYNIAEGAKFKLEYRFDYINFDTDADIDSPLSHSVLASFSYAF